MAPDHGPGSSHWISSTRTIPFTFSLQVAHVLYAIMGRDVPGSLELRRAARPSHLERIQALRDAGRLLLAGPHPAIPATDPGPAGFTGSLIVAEFASLDEAQAWANGDPYVTQGVFAEVSVLPFIKVLP